LIYYLVTARAAFTVETYLNERGRAWKRRIGTIPYESLHKLQGLPVGTYIFSDLDRLTNAQKQIAGEIYDFLASERSDLTLLNNPSKFVGRFDLLRMLHESGVNDFNVYRPYEIDDTLRFPVFLRFERDHSGPRTGLIESMEELDGAITEAIMTGAFPDNLMVVEFCDTSGTDGTFRKYSVWRFGKHFMARHMVVGKEWMLKVPRVTKGQSWPPEWVTEEERFLATNPHLNQVRQVFDDANIDYGRIDYGLKDGRIQVWEINSNPTCMTPAAEQLPERLHLDEIIQQRFDEGWAQIDCPLSPGPPIPFQVDHGLLLKSPIPGWAWG
jgi:hypothetical protein